MKGSNPSLHPLSILYGSTMRQLTPERNSNLEYFIDQSHQSLDFEIPTPD